MKRSGGKARQSVALHLLVVIAWLPYTFFHCVDCPPTVGAAHCGKPSTARHAGDAAGHEGHHAHHADAASGQQQEEPAHACCEARSKRDVTFNSVDLPLAPLLPSLSLEPVHASARGRVLYLAPLEGRAHAPPLYVVNRSLLI